MRGHETLRTPVDQGDSVGQVWENRGTNKDGPGTALTVFSGASPINTTESR